ncbi:acyltransferase family protein [Gemmatimonas sp.]|jgi:predicted acyltransferase|uniref:acyltransferase family protein n=1 Tax=Gemmatimonas sp. TaxID=1962908 RepID=UPI0037C12359
MAAAPNTGRPERLVSLDVFRGMTVAGMLLVNNPGTWSAIYAPLEHAAWNGWTPTDLIFPFFLFIVGITTELSLRARRACGDDDRAILRQMLRRGALIFLFGFLLSGFPFFTWPPALPEASFLERVVDRIEHWRVMGVLQRIGLAYLLGGLLTWRTTLRQQFAILIVLLVGYWALMTLVPVPDTGVAGRFVLDQPDQLLSAWLDRTILGTNHLWIGAKTWDPEGLLSTVPAIGTMLLGTFAGRWIARQERTLTDRLAGLFAVGALTMMLGLVWHWVFPINKSIWSSSYVLFTAGMGAVSLATCMWIIDVMQVRRWTFPFVVYGTNPMLAFLGSGLMARLISSIWTWEAAAGGRISAQGFVFNSLYASWLPPREASFAYALSFVALWFLILWGAWKRGFVLKV